MCKVRGIGMSAPMVLANLQGIKTETRRLTGLQEFNRDGYILSDFHQLDTWFHASFRWIKDPNNLPLTAVKCIYGSPGDLLYQRETIFRDSNAWRYRADSETIIPAEGKLIEMDSWSQKKQQNYAPSIHMPQFAARKWFEITERRVERLHDITPAGAIAEGIDIFKNGNSYVIPLKRVGKFRTSDPVHAYIAFANLLNGLNMQDNPWVWVVKYKHVDAPQEGGSHV